MRGSLANLPGVHLTYVAEIIPPSATALEEFESKYVEEGQENKGFISMDGKSKDIEFGILKRHIQRVFFEGLKKSVDYSIKVSTVVNGKTISEVCEDIEEGHEDLPEKVDEEDNVANGVEASHE